MNRRTVITIATVAALAGGGAAIAGAAGGDDDEKPITGPALKQASSAALAHVGSGRVTETEVGDEDGRYEVEVTKADGSQVDVHLDPSFEVTSTKADSKDDEDKD